MIVTEAVSMKLTLAPHLSVKNFYADISQTSDKTAKSRILGQGWIAVWTDMVSTYMFFTS